MQEHKTISMDGRARKVRWGYTVVNLYILTAIFLFVLSTTQSSSDNFKPIAGLMLIGAFVILPISAAILRKLNKSCREAHSTAQKRYLTVSKFIHVFAWLPSCIPAVIVGTLIVTDYCQTNKSSFNRPLLNGHKIIIKETTRPGVRGSPIKRTQSIHWSSGHIETLPNSFDHAEQYATHVLEADGYIFIPAGRTVFYRPGTISSKKGPWRKWAIAASQPLHAFFWSYAEKHNNKDVTIVPAINKRRVAQNPDDIVIASLATVTNSYIYYESGNFFSSAAGLRGLYMPHLIESIDPVTLKLIMKSDEAIASMPTHLVFSAIRTPTLTWEFDETETRKLEESPPAIN